MESMPKRARGAPRIDMSYTVGPTPASFFTTAHKHIGDFIRFSSRELKLHLQSAQIMHVNKHVLTVRMAEIPLRLPIDASASPTTTALPELQLDMGSKDNQIQYCDIPANATVSIAKPTPWTASHDPAALLYDRAHVGIVTDVEVTRMGVSEDNALVYTAAGRILQVHWQAHHFVAPHVEREDVIMRCEHSPINNTMHRPVQGDVLEILFPFGRPDSPKNFLNHHLVQLVLDAAEDALHQGLDATTTPSFLVQHDGRGFTPEIRQSFGTHSDSGPVQLRLSAKYLWYTKLSAGDQVYSDDAGTIKGIVRHVLKECRVRGNSRYAVEYPGLEGCVLQLRSQLACLAPKSMLSTVSGGVASAFF